MYQIKYKKSLVAFLDVIGFKSIVGNNDISLLEKYYTIIHNQLKDLKILKKEIDSFIVSDSIILITGTNIEDFTSMLISIAKIQAILGTQNIWLRGGISIGKLHFDKNSPLIVGEGLINAYLLEEKLANVPRILIDTKIINHFKTSKNEIKETLNSKFNGASVYQNILYNYLPLLDYNELYEDGFLYVSYTQYLICRVLNWDNLNSEYGVINNDFIKKFKTNMYSNSEYYPKYQWIRSHLQVSMIGLIRYMEKKKIDDSEKKEQIYNLRKEIQSL